MFSLFYFLNILLFLKQFVCRQRGREGEREGEKHQCVVVSHAPPTGDLAHNPGMCPDWELNRWPFGSQAGTQSTKPHQPGLVFLFLFFTLPSTPSPLATIILACDLWICFCFVLFIHLFFYIPHIGGIIRYLSSSVWLTSLSIMTFRLISAGASKISFFFMAE